MASSLTHPSINIKSIHNRIMRETIQQFIALSVGYLLAYYMITDSLEYLIGGLIGVLIGVSAMGIFKWRKVSKHSYALECTVGTKGELKFNIYKQGQEGELCIQPENLASIKVAPRKKNKHDHFHYRCNIRFKDNKGLWTEEKLYLPNWNDAEKLKELAVNRDA